MLMDVTTQCPHANGCHSASQEPGLAAKAGEKAKLARHGEDRRALALEIHGRIGPESPATLADLAAWTVVLSPHQGLRETALVQWRRLALQSVSMYEKADLPMQSLGGGGASWCCAAVRATFYLEVGPPL